MTQEALKLALEFVKSINLGFRSASVEQQRQVITALEEALAQTQEPVVLQYPQKDIDWQREQQIKAQASTPPQGIYYTPPQRTWVDLTRTQIQDVYFAVLEEHRGGHQMQGQLAFAEALQAKIKERNT